MEWGDGAVFVILGGVQIGERRIRMQMATAE
jgi:hypothetical protein